MPGTGCPKTCAGAKTLKSRVSSSWERVLLIRVAGDDCVVVYPALSVDESLNHYRVPTVPNRSRWLQRGVQKTGAGGLAKRFVTRQHGSGEANIPISSATPPINATVLAKPAVICHTRGRKVFCQRTRPRANFSWAVLADCCDNATRRRSPRLAGAFAGPMELISDCAFRHCANSAAQPEQTSRCAAISCMAVPVTAPSRYAENCSRKCTHSFTWPPWRCERFHRRKWRSLGASQPPRQTPPAEPSDVHAHALDAT